MISLFIHAIWYQAYMTHMKPEWDPNRYQPLTLLDVRAFAWTQKGDRKSSEGLDYDSGLHELLPHEEAALHYIAKPRSKNQREGQPARTCSL